LNKMVDSEIKAYIFGIILASDISKNSISIDIKNRKFFKLISKELLNFLPIKIEKSKKYINLIFQSKELLKVVSKFEINKIEPSLINHLVRGIVDKSGKISFVKVKFSSRESILNQIEEFYSIPAKRKRDTLTYKSELALDFLSKLYDSADIYLNKNYKKYMELSNFVSSKVEFKYTKLSNEAIAPFKSRASDSGYDLTLLKKAKTIGEVELYSTGIKVEPSYGYYFDLVPRSSIIKSGYILANSIGIIDRTYRGEIFVPLIKIDKNAKDLELPNRVVQLIPRSIIHTNFKESNELNETERCSKGFGSSGK